MVQIITFVFIFLMMILIVFYLEIKRLRKEIDKQKSETQYYKTGMEKVKKDLNTLYSQMYSEGKINEWKEDELKKDDDDIIADIINVNNSRM